MAELTPMMRQYMEEKEKHPDSLLFFRLGDFYEMFGPDARTASRELDLALTTRDKDKSKSDEERIPMCGVPYHSAEGYIARLIAKGYKVSICEQMEDPALAKGLVKREIIRTVTPGTVLGRGMPGRGTQQLSVRRVSDRHGGGTVRGGHLHRAGPGDGVHRGAAVDGADQRAGALRPGGGGDERRGL